MQYFITFRTYGTWLHGDERGSVSDDYNQWNEPLIEASDRLESYRRRLMKGETVIFNEVQRGCVALAIRDVATHRGWRIHAAEVLSNHVHVVVEANANIELVMRDFKAWATRRLRESCLVPHGVSLWSHHGSTRYLRDESSFLAACQYVRNQQNPERE